MQRTLQPWPHHALVLAESSICPVKLPVASRLHQKPSLFSPLHPAAAAAPPPNSNLAELLSPRPKHLISLQRAGNLKNVKVGGCYLDTFLDRTPPYIYIYVYIFEWCVVRFRLGVYIYMDLRTCTINKGTCLKEIDWTPSSEIINYCNLILNGIGRPTYVCMHPSTYVNQHMHTFSITITLTEGDV